MITSCQGSKKNIETQPNLKKEPSTKVEQTKSLETPPIPEPPKPPKKDNSTTLSLGEDVRVTDEGLSITTKIIYNETFDHAIFDDLLKKYVSNAGNVNYEGLKKEVKTLHQYIGLLKEFQPTDGWTKNDKLAYWINAYNALTIDLILRNYPVKSIKDIKDPWDQHLWKFGDKWLNLNAIEHEILRPMNEPRIHFAIVCASVSCPKLQNETFTAANLDEQLSKATKEFLNDTSKNELSEDHIKISKIFKWFKKDFEQNRSLIDFISTYSDIKISESAKKSYDDYNWDLND
jgi:hypothetical protein